MNSPDVLPTLVKMMSALIIVVGLVITTMYLLKKFMRNRGTSLNDDELIRIISQKYLGAKNSVMLVEILGHVLVVGLSNNGMSVLAHIDDEDFHDRIMTILDRDKMPIPFTDHLAFCTSRVRSLFKSVERNNRENG